MTKSFDLEGQRVVIIGGSSGIGLATAKLAAAHGASLVIAGRSMEKLTEAKDQIQQEETRVYSLDNRSQDALERFFSEVGPFDHLFTPGAAYTRGPITASLEIAKSCFNGKFWPQYMAVKYASPFISEKGSIVLMSGAYSQRPPKDGASYAACNAALESLGKALAVELAPVRVNVVAPGTIRTPFVWEEKGKEAREAAYEEYAQECILGKVGDQDDIAQAVVYLMANQYTTGSTLYPDGGYTLR